jgi:hypothetical protein
MIVHLAAEGFQKESSSRFGSYTLDRAGKCRLAGESFQTDVKQTAHAEFAV